MLKEKEKKSPIIMTVYSTKEKSLKKRLIYVRKFFKQRFCSNSDNGMNIGLFLKFNNAIGFSDIEYQLMPEAKYWDDISAPKEASSDDYLSPYMLLVRSLYFTNKENEIATFVVDNTRIYHHNKKYSYNTLEMIIKWQNFLYKVFPDIRIEFSLEKDFSLSERDWLLSRFLTCFAEGEIVDNECAVRKLTKEKDKEYILNVFKSLDVAELEFVQFYCKTCASYHPEAPYHTELSFKNGNYLQEV